MVLKQFDFHENVNGKILSKGIRKWFSCELWEFAYWYICWGSVDPYILRGPSLALRVFLCFFSPDEACCLPLHT